MKICLSSLIINTLLLLYQGRGLELNVGRYIEDHSLAPLFFSLKLLK